MIKVEFWKLQNEPLKALKSSFKAPKHFPKDFPFNSFFKSVFHPLLLWPIASFTKSLFPSFSFCFLQAFSLSFPFFIHSPSSSLKVSTKNTIFHPNNNAEIKRVEDWLPAAFSHSRPKKSFWQVKRISERFYHKM